MTGPDRAGLLHLERRLDELGARVRDCIHAGDCRRTLPLLVSELPPPIYAAKLREIAQAISRVVPSDECEAIAVALVAAHEVLQGGAHEGPCDYPPPFGPCSRHEATYVRRCVELRRALDALR